MTLRRLEALHDGAVDERVASLRERLQIAVLLVDVVDLVRAVWRDVDRC